jgi:hypothetical protein
MILGDWLRQPTHVSRPMWQRPTVLQCVVLILALKTGLRIWGYSKVISWLGRRLREVPATEWLDVDAVRTAERSVATAGALYPGRALCLEQSLVLHYLLRRAGVASRYCHGVAARPFQAHAWIEYRGQVMNDVTEHTRRFAKLPDQLP